MSRWEYATIYFFRGIGGTTLLYLPDGSEQKLAGTLLELTRLLNLLGRDGWEVVTTEQDSLHVWTLKRPLKNEF